MIEPRSEATTGGWVQERVQRRGGEEAEPSLGRLPLRGCNPPTKGVPRGAGGGWRTEASEGGRTENRVKLARLTWIEGREAGGPEPG